MKEIMVGSFCESDLVATIINFADELVDEITSALKHYQLKFANYEIFNVISTFLITFKELLLVSVLKLKNLGITSISSHDSITYLKSKLTFIEYSVQNFASSLENITEEHKSVFKDILEFFSSLNNDEVLLK